MLVTLLPQGKNVLGLNLPGGQGPFLCGLCVFVTVPVQAVPQLPASPEEGWTFNKPPAMNAAACAL